MGQPKTKLCFNIVPINSSCKISNNGKIFNRRMVTATTTS